MEEFDEELREDKEESEKKGPWYVDAVNRAMKLKEEAEEDLLCDVDYNPIKRINTTAMVDGERRCIRRMETELEISSKMLHGKGKCTVEVWRCFSKVLEKMLKYVEDPREIYKQVFSIFSEIFIFSSLQPS